MESRSQPQSSHTCCDGSSATELHAAQVRLRRIYFDVSVGRTALRFGS